MRHWPASLGRAFIGALAAVAMTTLGVADEGRERYFKAIIDGDYKRVQTLAATLGDKVRNRAGETPLQAAISVGNLNMVRLLIDKLDHPIEAPDLMTPSPLAHAILNKEDRIARYLLDKGGSAKALNQGLQPPLYVACQVGNRSFAKQLLAAGADPNHYGLAGETPFTLACQSGDPQLVELLLAHGAKIDAPTLRGQSPLDRAVAAGSIPLTRLLLSKGANATTKQNGIPLIAIAAYSGNAELVQLLIDQKLSPDEGFLQDPAVSRPIHIACSLKNPKVLDVLLKAKADPWARSPLGADALMIATAHEFAEGLRLLSNRGITEAARPESPPEERLQLIKTELRLLKGVWGYWRGDRIRAGHKTGRCPWSYYQKRLSKLMPVVIRDGKDWLGNSYSLGTMEHPPALDQQSRARLEEELGSEAVGFALGPKKD